MHRKPGLNYSYPSAGELTPPYLRGRRADSPGSQAAGPGGELAGLLQTQAQPATPWFGTWAQGPILLRQASRLAWDQGQGVKAWGLAAVVYFNSFISDS